MYDTNDIMFVFFGNLISHVNINTKTNIELSRHNFISTIFADTHIQYDTIV